MPRPRAERILYPGETPALHARSTLVAMRKLVAFAPLAAALALVSAASASAPVVPVFTQHRIASRAPAVAFVPARLATGWRYRNWQVRAGVLRIWFASHTEPRKTIVFVATPFHGSCRAGMARSFQMAGVKVWWGRTPNEQEAWRCVHGLKLVAATAMPPTRFAPAGLARVAASGHRIR